MPKKDSSHDVVKNALIKNGWEITDDPYVISRCSKVRKCLYNTIEIYNTGFLLSQE